jgi:hypothetical protein
MAAFDHAEDPRRRWLVRALGAGLLGVSGAGAVAQTLLGSLPGQLPAGRSVYRITGRVTVNGQPATLETRINANDTIQTGRGSEIIFVVGTQAMLLRAQSHLKLQSEDQQQGSNVVSILRMLSGKLLSVSRNQPMSLTTPTATIGIRGTGVYVEADPELTYFCTCYGITDVVAASDPESRYTVVSTHHDRPLYITTGRSSGQNIQPAGFKNHTDQELMLIETLVGRSTPFVSPSRGYEAPQRGYEAPRGY